MKQKWTHFLCADFYIAPHFRWEFHLALLTHQHFMFNQSQMHLILWIVLEKAFKFCTKTRPSQSLLFKVPNLACESSQICNVPICDQNSAPNIWVQTVLSAKTGLSFAQCFATYVPSLLLFTYIYSTSFYLFNSWFATICLLIGLGVVYYELSSLQFNFTCSEHFHKLEKTRQMW